jgi:hypothetical protein
VKWKKQAVGPDELAVYISLRSTKLIALAALNDRAIVSIDLNISRTGGSNEYLHCERI